MKIPLFQTIDAYSQTHNLIPPGSKIIIGLSGGPDSVYLMHYLASKQKEDALTLIAAHLDHAWRSESGNDAHFCQKLAQELGIPFISRKLSELDLNLTNNGSKEEMGRKARRYFFEQIKKDENADFIALAHHAQDQQETFFIRLIRGSSLSGLAAMKPKDGAYIRPLLEIQKTEIIKYLKEQNIAYLIDPSNESAAYLRNRIRSKVIPALKLVDHRFDQNFEISLKRLQDTEEFLQSLMQETFQHISQKQNDKITIDIEKLLTLNPVLQYRILLHWLCTEKVKFPPSQSFFDEMLRFLKTNESKEHQVHQSWSIVKNKNQTYISHSKK